MTPEYPEYGYVEPPVLQSTETTETEPEPAAIKVPRPWATGTERAIGSEVTQLLQYNRQLVVDVDFDISNPITVAHSFNSDRVYVSLCCLGSNLVTPGTPPSVTFDNPNEFTLWGSWGQYRVWVQVVP